MLPRRSAEKYLTICGLLLVHQSPLFRIMRVFSSLVAISAALGLANASWTTPASSSCLLAVRGGGAWDSIVSTLALLIIGDIIYNLMRAPHTFLKILWSSPTTGIPAEFSNHPMTVRCDVRPSWGTMVPGLHTMITQCVDVSGVRAFGT